MFNIQQLERSLHALSGPCFLGISGGPLGAGREAELKKRTITGCITVHSALTMLAALEFSFFFLFNDDLLCLIALCVRVSYLRV